MLSHAVCPGGALLLLSGRSPVAVTASFTIPFLPKGMVFGGGKASLLELKVTEKTQQCPPGCGNLFYLVPVTN